MRVRALAYMRAARNVGYTLGALAGGIALAIGTREAIIAVPILTGVLLLLNAVMVATLPVDRAARGPRRARRGRPAPAPPAWRNLGFVVLSACNGVLTSNQVLLNVVVPLWLVERTDAPHTLLAWLFGTNTVMAVALQVRASRGSETVPGALRAVRLLRLVVRAVVPGHQRHPRDRRLGLDRPDLAGPRDDHRCGAVAVGLRLGLPVRAVRPPPARRLPGRLGPGLPGRPDHLPGPLHLPRPAVGRARLGRDRGLAVVAAVVAHPAARAAERYLERAGASYADVASRAASAAHPAG